MARAFKLVGTDASHKALDVFSDKNDIATWALDSLDGMVEAGYIQGSDGKLNPKANITRAEFAVVMDNLVKQYIDKAGTVTKVVEKGNVLVREAGVILKDVTIKGDLIIADGVGEGDVILDNVKIEGRTVIRGGGENSIAVIGNSNLGKVILAKVDGVARINIKNNSKVEDVYVDDGSDDVIVEGEIGILEVAGDNVIATAIKATIVEGIVSGDNSKIILKDGSRITRGFITGEDSAIIVEKNASVDRIIISGPNATVEGEGIVINVEVQAGGDGTVVSTPNTKTIIEEGVEGVVSGVETTEPNRKRRNPNRDTQQQIGVTGVSLDQKEQLLEKDSTLQLSATVSPSNASNKKISWESGDESIATVDNNGLVTAIKKGTTTITVTTEDGSKTDVIQITVPIIVSNAAELEGAVDSAEDGDTIFLKAGRYELTKTLVIDKSIKILGPQANVDPRPSKATTRKVDDQESILTGDKGDTEDYDTQAGAKGDGDNKWLASIFEIKAKDVVINGLTMERTYDNIVYCSKDGEEALKGLEIINNIIRRGRGNEGIKIANTVNALVQYNYIHDILKPGDAIEAYSNVKGFRILDNEIDGCSSVNGSIRVRNNESDNLGIVKDNLIKNTGYHFAIAVESSKIKKNGGIIIDGNTIINTSTGGIFIYKNESNSEEELAKIEITNNTIENYAIAPVQGDGYKEKYLRDAASAIAVSFNLKSGIQPEIIISGNTTKDGAEGFPVLCFDGGTPDSDAVLTDLTRVIVSGNAFDQNIVKYTKDENKDGIDLTNNIWPN